MRSVTYYLPKKEKKVAANHHTSVVVLDYEGKFARGVAITSDRDQFNRKRGRAIAMGRAVKALESEKTCRRNKIRRPRVFSKTEFKNKCSYMPVLTYYEQKLLGMMA